MSFYRPRKYLIPVTTSFLASTDPWMRRRGGFLTTGAMAAAIESHMDWLGYAVRVARGLLFCMVVTTFTCGFTVLSRHRHQIPLITPNTYR